MVARISENYRYDATIDRINTARTAADDVNDIASSGRKLRRVSDDPVSTVKVFRNREKLSHIGQFKKTLEFAKGFLTKTETTLGSLHDSLIRAKELAIQQSNNTYDDASRISVAAEIKQIMAQVVNLGNSQYDNKYIFGGFQTSHPPISLTGDYLGDDGQIFLELDEKTFRPINVNGRQIFDVPPGEEGTRPPLVQILSNLHDSLLHYDPDKLHEAMDNLDGGMNSVLTATASLGARRNTIDDIQGRLEQGEVQLYDENGKLEGEDPVKSALDLKKMESSLQFNLQATSKMLAPSLLDFLK